MLNLNIANKGLLVLLGIFTTVLYGHALFFAEVSLDAGYYLGVAQQLVQGKVMYRDVLNNYTPFAMHYFAVVMGLFGESYAVLLFSLFCILFLSAYFLYRCAAAVTGNKVLSLVLSFLYLISCYYYDASYIYLEPFVNLFGLVSVYCLIRWEKSDRSFFIFLSGAFACLAFLSKQYGIIYVVFCGIYAAGMLFYKPELKLDKLLKTWFLIGLGTSFPVLLLLLVYAFLDVSPIDFFSRLIVKAYADESAGNYFRSSGSFLFKTGLVFFLVPVLFFFRPVKPKTEMFRMFLFWALLFLLTSVYYVKVFPHYSLLLLPAAFLIIVSLYQVIAVSRNEKWSNIFCIILWLSVVLTSARTASVFWENQGNWNREKQFAIAAAINKVLPPESQALLISDFHYYYLCNLEPYLPEKYGYSFFDGLWPAHKQELLEEADVILLHKRFKERYPELLKGQAIEIHPGDLLIIRKQAVP